ncbi:MAG TPA: acyltransferase [Bryobacteraceae bacterium]
MGGARSACRAELQFGIVPTSEVRTSRDGSGLAVDYPYLFVRKNVVPPSTPSSPSKHRDLALDGVRGVAIAGVLATHMTAYLQASCFPRWLFAAASFGWAGVDLFFVLSGFLITGILLDTREAVNRSRSFYMRRLLRIAPIYYLTLLVILLALSRLWWIAAWLPKPGWDRWCYLVYLQNVPQLWGHHFHGPNVIGHFWSLAVEEQFYLVWPMVIWLLPRRLLMRVCIVGSVCVFGFRLWLLHQYGPQVDWSTWLPARGGESLMLGSALAIICARQERITRRALAILAVCGISILCIGLLPGQLAGFKTNMRRPSVGFTGIALISVALVASTRHSLPGLLALLRSEPLRALGKYSYGLYVYHVPLYLAAAHAFRHFAGRDTRQLNTIAASIYALLVMAMCFGVAWLSWRFIEKPILDRKRHFRPVYSLQPPATPLQAASNTRESRVEA